MSAAPIQDTKTLVIQRPNVRTAVISIKGTAPYVQNAFDEGKAARMLATQTKPGSKSKKREARDVSAEFEAAQHRMTDGRRGIPAAAFRSALISACRVAGFVMTKAKLSVWVEPDGFDAGDGTPLVAIEGEPEVHQSHVRLESGVASIAIRPMWREWAADVRVRYDADQFSDEDVVNLMMRAGLQVGIGEGRNDSRKSHGMGWGSFEIIEMKE